jgi:hypothetical protein
MFTDDDLDVRTSDLYNWFTTKGVKLKSNNTSLSREAMQDGFFGSLEAALTTTADVALQIALAGGLGRAGAGAAGMINGGLTGAALQQAQNKAAEISVRGVLTAMSVKDSYNEAIENGFSTSEASVITGAMAVAMWKATKYASYILGDFEVKVLRENIKTAMQAEQQGMLKTLFASVAEKAPKVAAETKAKYALEAMQKVVSGIFGKVTKVLPSSHMAYVARQEGFEEMTEELFQDGVKQVASAYGALINNAHEAGKGRYSTIFDDGYFKDAVERYLTSGVAGAIGGPMGMVGNKVKLSPITSTSTMTDILMDGRKEELLSVLTEMKSEGSLGPKDLSTEWNDALEAFEPVIQGAGNESLADMIFKQYEHDINVVDTFINQGMFGEAKSIIEDDDKLKDFVDNNSMRKDFVSLMGNMLQFHNATGISMSVYSELDEMSETDLFKRLPTELKKNESNLVLKNQQIAEIKEAAKAKAPVVVIDETKETEKPKTEKKKKEEKIIGETPDSKLTRLEKEVKLSATVKDKDIVTMLSNYRKIRAISTGVASEYYLLQNEMANHTMLGSKYNREEKYASLGTEPFKDMLLAMRFRAKSDELVHAQTQLAATELEAKIVSIADSSNEGISSLETILKDANYGLLSEKALRAIVKMYEKADFEKTANAFDAKHENSIFARGADGKATEADMLDLYKEIMLLTDDNNAAMVAEGKKLDDELTPEFVAKYFRSVSKDIRTAVVPEWDASMDSGLPEEQDYGTNLIERIMARGSTRLLGALKVSGEHVMTMKAMGDTAAKAIMMESFYRNDPYKRKGVNALFKKASGDTLLTKTLVDDGLSNVRALLDSGHEGIYTMTDNSGLDEVLRQIEIRVEVAKVLAGFLAKENGHAGHYMKMLAGFRQNVLDIIDFKYGYSSNQDTEIEEHSYKDYSVTSDFFADFLYDPILMMELVKKDPELFTQADKETMNEMVIASTLLRPTVVKGMGFAEYENVNLEMDQVALESYLDSLLEAAPGKMIDFRTMEGAVKFFESSKVLSVPALVLGIQEDIKIPLHFDGVTKMMAAKWLFKKSSEFIAKVADKATPLPYIKSKNNDNSFTMRALRGLLEDENIQGLSYIMEKEEPEIAVALAQDTEDMTPNDVGALNIKIENALFRIYNNIGLKTELDNDEHLDLKDAIDDYIAGVNGALGNTLSNNTFIVKAAETAKKLSILVGAVTTDFTPFYKKFKRDIEAMTEYDNIVVAAQEHAAKHAGAFVYSSAYREMADSLSEQRMAFMESVDHISAVYVTGTAGSGKSSSVIQMGLRLAVEILEDNGHVNTAVLPVSTYDSQIEIVSKSVGALSKGLKGMSVADLHLLLQAAVNAQDADAIKTLSVIGIIAIDEATYVQAEAIVDDNKVALEDMNDLIRTYNSRHNVGGHDIGLVLLGDPKQSGAVLPHENNLYETSLKARRAHPIAYMDFSFRSRNNYLGDSLSAIATTIDVSEGDMGYKPDFLKLEPGTKFGTAGGKFYGIQMVDAANKESTEDFYKVLNDTTLIANIEANIIKTIAENESRPEGSPEIKFNVLIAPTDVVSFKGSPSKMRTLMEKEGYEKFFKLVQADMVGGTEANYVIGEIAIPENNTAGITYIKMLAKTLNTLATRAFDYAIIVNRNDSIIIPAEAASTPMPDGDVMIPDTTLDSASKMKLKRNYMEIFKDIVSDGPASIASGPSAASGTGASSTSTGAALLGLPAAEKILGLMPATIIPGVEFTIPKDTFALNYQSIIQFTDGENALLSARRNTAVLKNLTAVEKELVSKYFTKASVLLRETGADNRVTQIEELDEIIKELEPTISKELYQDLVGLQVFIVELDDDSAHAIMDAHLSVGVSSLLFTQEDFSTEMYEDLTVADFINEAERAINDSTLSGTYDAMMKELMKTEEEDEEREDAFMNSFMEDIQASLLDVNPDSPKLPLSDELEIKLNNVLADIVVARAVLVMTALHKEAQAVDLVTISKQVDDFSIWASVDLNDRQLTALIKQLKPGTGTLRMTLPPDIMNLYHLGFTADSITDALYNAALLVKKKKDATKIKKKKVARVYTDSLERMALLKGKLGISPVIIGSMPLYDAINKAEALIWKGVQGNIPTAKQKANLASILEVQDLWNRLYKGHSSTFGKDGYGKGFVYRPYTTNVRKATLEDYIDNFERSPNIFTNKITDQNRYKGGRIVSPISNKKQKSYSPKEVFDVFNFKGDKVGNTPSQVVIRLVRDTLWSKDNKPTVTQDILIMAADNTTNHVVAQLDSRSDSPKIALLREQLFAVLEKAKNDNTKVFRKGDMEIMDIEVEGGIKDFLYVRPGGIVAPDAKGLGTIRDDEYLIAPIPLENGFKQLSVAELTKGGLNLSTNLYVSLNVAEVTALDTDIGDMNGEGFYIYTTDNSTKDLDAEKMVKMIKNGHGLDEDNRGKDTSGQIASEIGVMRVMLKAPLDELGEVLVAHPEVQMGAFTSHFSVALQQHFVNHGSSIKLNTDFILSNLKPFPLPIHLKELLKTAKVGDEIKTDIEGIHREFIVRQDHIDTAARTKDGAMFKVPLEVMESHQFTFDHRLQKHYTDMSKHLDRHYAEKGKEYQDRIEEILKTMKKNDVLKTSLDDFATGYLVNKGMYEGPSSTKVSSIIYPSESGGYIFNVNEYLRGNSAATLRKLTMLSDVAQFTLKPNVLKGKNDNMGIVSNGFSNQMDKYLKTPVAGIKLPSFIISASGAASLRIALTPKAPTAPVIYFSEVQAILLEELKRINALVSVEVTDNLLSLGLDGLIKMKDDIESIGKLIEGNTNYTNQSVLLQVMKVKIDGVLDEAKNRAAQADKGAPEKNIPDFVKKSNDPNHPVRAAYAKVYLEFMTDSESQLNPETVALREEALETFQFLSEKSIANGVKAGLLEWADPEFVEFLNKCSF